eukprot:6000253-Heterocapsa_arctica.AAC.1
MPAIPGPKVHQGRGSSGRSWAGHQRHGGGDPSRSIRQQDEERKTRVRTYADDLTLAKTGTAQEVAEAL